MWRKAMDYLGLGPDDAYDDYDEYEHRGGRERDPRDRDYRDRDPRDRDPRDRDPRDREYRDRDPRGGRDRRDRDPRDRDPRDRDPRDRDPRERDGRGGYDDYDEAPSRSATRPTFPQRDGDVVVRRPAPAPDDSSVQPRPTNGGRPASRGGKNVEPHSVKPRRFDSAQEVADHFRDGVPVIMNLEGCDKETSRRLIDFASGLCYGLSGNMEKVATGVYLLKPYGSRHDD